MYSVLKSVGNLLLLIALIYLPASVQYPVVTGGVIIISTLIVIIRKEKITKRELLAACCVCCYRVNGNVKLVLYRMKHITRDR